MSHLSRETKELLERGRGGEPLREAHRRRLKRTILWKAALASLLTASAPAAAWTSGAVKIVAVVSAIAVTGAGAVLGVRVWRGGTEVSARATPSSSAPPVTRVTASSPVVASAAPPVLAPDPVAPVAPMVPMVAMVPMVIEAAPARRGPGTSPPVSAPAMPAPAPASSGSALASPLAPPGEPPSPAVVASSDPVAAERASSLESEARLLRDAHAALAGGDAEAALRLLDAHAARYPESVLEPERSAERIFALCAATPARGGEASSAADAFLARYSTGPLAARVRASCGSVKH